MSLKIANSRIRDAVLNGVPATGPPSLRSRWSRLRYRSPEGLNNVFNEAIKIVEAESKVHKDQAAKAQDPAAKELALAKAELHNPEVKYNHLVNAMDLSQPVYKLLAQRDWMKREMLVLMQRLEQHHVIPDTLPTLDPQAEVKLQFLTPNMRWIEPGEWIASDVSGRTPSISIKDYGIPAGESAQYTVLIVNPDVPDLENDSFRSWLHFAATNVSASLSNPKVELKAPVVPYVPPHPEKNAPGQRLCVWVLRQTKPVNPAEIERDGFDIREFVAANDLTPVGGTLWRSKWDLATDAIREKYNLPPGNVYFRARTDKPDEALLHVSERPKWMKVDGLA